MHASLKSCLINRIIENAYIRMATKINGDGQYPEKKYSIIIIHFHGKYKYEYYSS